jgi:hypothetical protein
MTKKHRTLWGVATIAAAGVCLGCGRSPEPLRPAAGPALPRAAPPAVQTTDGKQLYVAVLTPLNEELTPRPVTGRVTFIVDERENTLTATVWGQNLSAGTRAAYFHASADGTVTSCPTRNADQDGNGVVDLAELKPYAGEPLLPLNENFTRPPGAGPFPAADPDGTLNHRATVSLADLGTELSTRGDRPLSLERGVVILYGVGDGDDDGGGDVTVPPGIAPLDDLPAAASVPVACGEVSRVG